MSAFRRLNFFKGLLTTAENWIAEQEYHRAKHSFHNKCQHFPGIIPGQLDELKVEVAGPRSINVRPGYAIDAEGRELCLDEEMTLDAPNEANGVDSYVYIKYHKEFTEEVRDRSAESEGGQKNVYVAEKAVVKWETRLPNNRDEIVLARVRILRGQDLGAGQIKQRGIIQYSTARISSLAWEGEDKLDKPTGNKPFSETVFLIDDFRTDEEALRFSYLATVIPLDPVPEGIPEEKHPFLSWNIESLRDDRVRYFLRVKCAQPMEMRFKFKVHRLTHIALV